ncbi:hypothetical protein BDN72DRAFT_278172 [Pluteus cervinus]|uniref:Uncharacterized protein n=1 Tax=Pluteus cervinus TaxID=181527 RepID=A0ACD3AFA0_9AGAR|nr:hypothetical protein BDN72DRAFT_278172 [Pluteus cervinus]
MSPPQYRPLPNDGVSMLYPRMTRPILVLVFQSALLCFLWGFHWVTRRNAIMLPAAVVDAYYVYGTETFTFVVTLISSGITILTAYLYSLAIRHMLVIYLATTPTSFFAVSSTIKVAGKSPLMNFEKPMWTFASILCAVALGAQTAGWATLLTPQPITLKSRIDGRELDLSNAAFIDMSTQDAANYVFNHYINVVPLLQASGAVLINTAMMGRPATINYNNMSFFGRTGGVLPATLYNTSSAINTALFLPAVGYVIDPPTRIPTGLSRNYTVTQQGLSANISCVQQNLTPTTSPSWTQDIETPTSNMDIPAKIMFSMSTVCPSGNTSFSSPGFPANATAVPTTVYYAVCGSNTGDSTVIIQGVGVYGWMATSVCKVAPYITTVDVTYVPVSSYVDQDLVMWPGMVQVGPWRNASYVPSAGIAPLMAMQDTFYSAQGINTHAIGNALSAFHNFTDPTGGPNITDVLAMYLTGLFEASGTILRASYSQTNDTLEGDPHPNMLLSLNGTFVAETLGWKSSSTTPISMIPPTIVLLLSILLATITLIRFRGKIARGLDNFDPGNSGHIIAAAAAGGLDHEHFPDFSAGTKDQSAIEQKIIVRLGQTPKGLGFVATPSARY